MLTFSRHGHLMLFDDDEQIEVRHVVSLQHHTISIYSGGDETPEGELFIKRNAICLSRRSDVGEMTPDGKTSKPFFLFSDSCSEKEDFYFALLRNQERRPDMIYNPPIPLQYELKDIITLVQRLHSSEEHLQTRWINAIIGRIFLALYKTPEVENFVRAKITKKISRVKTPSFLSKISLRDIDMGEAAPVITNPRLKDLTVDGELVVEADMRYSGGSRIEVAATARIELGSRFKAREVNLLLAVVLKRLEGHVMIRIKPPPSNRIWVTFATMPKIDMVIEPIVSSRQITYTLILRQIENRIKEVVAESLVYPNWDDSPFYHSENKAWRGGIWADANDTRYPENPENTTEQGDVDEIDHLEGETDESIMALPQAEKSISSPALVDISPQPGAYSRKHAKSAASLSHSKSSGSSTSVESRSAIPDKPRALRSGSFANASTPVISTDTTNADAFKHSGSPPEHSHAIDAIAAISALQNPSPTGSPVGSMSRPSRMEKPGSHSSSSSQGSVNSGKGLQNDLTPQPSINLSNANSYSNSSSHPPSPASMVNSSKTPSIKSFASFGIDQRRDSSLSTLTAQSSGETKRLSLAAVANAAATAKKWSWNAIQRHTDQKSEDEVPSHPLVMGRGQPLPPPGMPLPFPDKRTKTAPIPVPKRKPIPPPNMPQKHKNDSGNGNGSETNGFGMHRHHVPPPPLPKRRHRNESSGSSGSADDGLFVVAAPAGDSEPTTPLEEHAPSYMQPWVDDAEEDEELPPKLESEPEPIIVNQKEPPRLPRRRPHHRIESTSPEEDGHHLPSWMAAQEQEARAKSTFVDEDGGVC